MSNMEEKISFLISNFSFDDINRDFVKNLFDDVSIKEARKISKEAKIRIKNLYLNNMESVAGVSDSTKWRWRKDRAAAATRNEEISSIPVIEHPCRNSVN